MEVRITDTANKDFAFWKKSGQKSVMAKIDKLILSIENNPYSGIGKPEPLKYGLSGSWSREITKKDRIVYEVIDNIIYIYSARGHYEK